MIEKEKVGYLDYVNEKKNESINNKRFAFFIIFLFRKYFCL